MSDAKLFAHTCVAGLVSGIGQRLASPFDGERSWRGTLRGSIVLELTFLLPVLGWFVLLPAAVIIGAGAMTVSPLKRTFAARSTAPLGEASEVAGFRA